MSDEHVIPESLGGRLVAPFLCRLCNSSLGHRYEYAVRSDPTIRLLVNELAVKIPAVAQFVGNNQAHIAVGPGPGTKKGYVKDGEFRILSTREADGSLVQSTPSAKRAVDRMLQKEGYDASFRADALARIDQAPESLPIELTPALTIVKWEITGLKLALDGPTIDPVVPVKTAFEFLALHLGTAIYDNAPPLAEIRRALTSGSLDPQWISVERLHAPKAQPFHGIAFEGNSPHAKVQIRLFGKLAFRVHFLRLSVGGPQLQYTHELDTEKEFCSEIPKS